MKHAFTGLAALIALSSTPSALAQASGPPSAYPPIETVQPSTVDRAVEQTRAGLGAAALSPLEDLNLRNKVIPRNLAQLESPYDLPAHLSCGEITRLVRELDASLGDDWDAPQIEEDRSRSERVADGTSSATLGAVASEARGLIPFRGVVRTVTGANRYANRRDKAYALGAQQRAYLKGMGAAHGCAPPASPRPHDSVSRIIYHGARPTER